MKLLIIHDDKRNFLKIKYIFDFIFNLPICNSKFDLEYLHIDKFKAVDNYSIVINYGVKTIKEATINIIKRGNILNMDSKEEIQKLKSNKYKYNNQFLYGISNDKLETQNFINNNIINLDIVQTFFFHLSRMEEFYATNEQLDYHERMKSNEQFLVKNNIYRTPVLDEISFAFLEILGLEKQIKTDKVISHDIDVIEKFPNLYKFIRGSARILFKNKKNKGSLIKYISWFFRVKFNLKKDPYKTFLWLFSKSNEKKIVYFMSGGLTKYDNLYNINNPIILDYINIAKENNYEIGLHPSYAAYNNEEQFQKEKIKLEQIGNCKIASSRQHILHFNFKTTIKTLLENNIESDSTLGYQDKIGFRAGTGFEFYLWNFINNEKTTILERPLVIMDGCLLIEADYNVNKAKEILVAFENENKNNTQITYNFHNSIFDPVLLNDGDLKQLFLEI